MQKNQMCPNCGSTDKQFAGAFCVDCFPLLYKMYSITSLDVKKCSKCGRFRIRNAWVSEQALVEWIKGKIKTNYDLQKATVQLNPRHDYIEAKLDLVFNVKGAPVKKTESIRINLEKTVCLDDSRQASGYHEAIIQVRGTPERIQKAVQKIGVYLQKKTIITEVKELKEGIDLLVFSRKTTEQALSELGYDYSVTFKLITEKRGKKIYRATYCVRV